MDSHLDALGYLLAAVVFSVGFLSGRVHSNLDSTMRAVGERSWRVRQAISEGGRLGPADLADLLGVVHGSTDYVAAGSRILNWAIFGTTLAVLVDAFVLLFSGTEAPDHVMIVLTLLFAASLAVVVFSEFDVRRVSIERQREIDASTLGRLQKLAKLMAAEEIPEASRELSRLRETFPTWGLLVELEAYLDLLMGRPRDGLDQIESLISSDGDLHVSPIVGTACCLELGGLDSALELLTRIERREGSDDYPGLHRALAVSAGHLSALLASRDYPTLESSAIDRNPSHSVTQELIGEEIERRREPVRNLAFDLDPAKMPQTAPLVATLGQWEHGSTLRDFDSSLALSTLLTVILEPGERRDVSAALQAFATKCRDPLTLESFGLVAFASGEPRTALGFFEAAIRLAPAAARSHWGRAIACHRVGWLDAASASLRRVATLSDDVPLLSITRRVFQENAAPIDPLEVANAYPSDMDDLDRFELALLGIEVEVEGGTSIQRRFTSRLVELALQNNQLAVARV
jgi:hypothetical protein